MLLAYMLAEVCGRLISTAQSSTSSTRGCKRRVSCHHLDTHVYRLADRARPRLLPREVSTARCGRERMNGFQRSLASKVVAQELVPSIFSRSAGSTLVQAGEPSLECTAGAARFGSCGSGSQSAAHGALRGLSSLSQRPCLGRRRILRIPRPGFRARFRVCGRWGVSPEPSGAQRGLQLWRVPSQHLKEPLRCCREARQDRMTIGSGRPTRTGRMRGCASPDALRSHRRSAIWLRLC